MGNNWTVEQKSVIEHSNGDLLVAAAAGSGKTAVLVERIVTMLQDKKDPVDIDRMLVVTFTRAAAAEMRERIGNRIAELLTEQPDNELLQRQQMLLQHAAITTLDSFCMQVVKEFFHTIDIDPGFRIGDSAEMKLLQSDVIKEVLEENYAAADGAFLRLVESYAPGKTDAALEDYVIKLHLFSESYEWPVKWLEGLADSFAYEDEEVFASSPLCEAVMKEVAIRTELALRDIKDAQELVNEAAVEGYRATVQNDAGLLEQLSRLTDYRSYSAVIRAYNFDRIGNCSKSVDPEAREQVKALRDRCKDTVNDLIKQYFFQDSSEMYEDLRSCAPHMKELVRLTLAFREKYMAAKQGKNLMEFADLGHYALQILLAEKDGIYEPTEAAGILMRRFDRIMVDEYQDSNKIQESLLGAISRKHDVSADYPEGRPNIFTVGDVKQSIYRFRQARPELFMDKYKKYGQGNPDYRKIILKKNFRSRPNVLDAVNSVFSWAMYKEFGGIEYDTDAALHVRDGFDKCDGTESPYDPELILLHQTDAKEEETVEKMVAEARICGERILRIIDEENGLLITDKEGVRRARPGDVAILLRTAKGWSETFVNVLKDMGIQASATVSTGFFEAGEVISVLNYLKILDNPNQDIPLAQILLSPVYGFTNDELAAMKTGAGNLFELMNRCVQSQAESGLHGKVAGFLEEYTYFRKRMKYLSVSELIQEIYRKTKIYTVMAALPAGRQRVANLEYLLRHAQNFETTSYHGLFQFVRYVEKLKDNEVDFGEASTAESMDAVKIMTIHKSKGLEFPVVLVPACGKQFNQMDANTRIVLHADYGLGPECIDSETRTKVTTLKKQYLRQIMKEETIAEELRMLYVAMTRAREKLILVGSTQEAGKFLESCAGNASRMDYRKLASANSYLDFLKGIVLRTFADKNPAALAEDNPVVLPVTVTGTKVVWHYIPLTAGDISVEETMTLLDEEEKRQALLDLVRSVPASEETGYYTALKKCLAYRYPYEEATRNPLKTSVSELKRRQNTEEAQEQEAYVPAWVSPVPGIGAAERGTLYHKVMELLPIETVRTKDELLAYLNGLTVLGRMTEEELQVIETDKVLAFLESGLAERLRAARGRIKREQPFVLGLETADGNRDYELIQGIIDLYFEEDDGIVLVDYKTDRVENAEELVKRYRVQLDYYAEAIARITGKKVKEKLIYSLHLSKTISLE